MTIAELRSLLAQYPDDMLVMVDGYEYGYSTPLPEVCSIALNRYPDIAWAGLHGEARENNDATRSALVLHRQSGRQEYQTLRSNDLPA